MGLEERGRRKEKTEEGMRLSEGEDEGRGD